MQRPTSASGRARRLAPFSIAVSIATVVLAASPAWANAAITSAGPLTNVAITSDLNCAVNHTGDASPEFYGGTACATLVATGGTLYGPASIPAGVAAAPRTTFTPVGQSAVTGTGTAADPFRIETVVDLGSTGLRLTETDSYVVGQESYRTDVRISNNGTTTVPVIAYRAGDCFLQNSDYGYGLVGSPPGAVACATLAPPNTGGRIEQWLPITAGSHYVEDNFNTVWADIGTQQPFPDTCQCASLIDNGAGLSWSLDVPAGGSKTVSSLITFSPTGVVPLSTTKTADVASVSAGGQDGYTIIVDNPNAQDVSLASISDTLPAGFDYVPGSTTGATTSDPSTSGQTITWSGPFTVPASDSVTLHFGVTVSSVVGTYFNNATADAGNVSVAPTGDTAPVQVTQAGQQLTVTKQGSGTGTVTSSPAGIDCGATCQSDFASGTQVSLTATPDAGSTFAGWGGACNGTGACVVTMDQARSVVATFDLVPAPVTPKAQKQAAVDSLRPLLPTGDAFADQKIRYAIREIGDSVKPKFWSDDSHLVADIGRRVFHEEAEAATALSRIPSPPATVGDVLDALIAVDRALAQTAIDEVTAAGGDASLLARAQRSMQQADQAALAGAKADGIRLYGRAWSLATQA